MASFFKCALDKVAIARRKSNHLLSWQPKIVFFFCQNYLWSKHPFIKRQTILPSSHWSGTLCCQWESLTTFPLQPQRSHKPQKEKWSQYSLRTETWISHNAPVGSWAQSVWCWSLIRRDRREVLWRWTLFVPGSKHQSLPGSMQTCSDQDTNSPSLQPPLKQHRPHTYPEISSTVPETPLNSFCIPEALNSRFCTLQKSNASYTPVKCGV